MYGDDSCPSQLQSLAEGPQVAGVEGQRDGKLCSSGEGGTDGKYLPVCICIDNLDTVTCLNYLWYMYVWLHP